MSLAPLVSIITINYNNTEDTIEFLKSIYASSFKDFEVIMVDNSSVSFDPTQISDEYPEVKIIESDENLGFAGGNNLGLEMAKGEYIFFVNNDTIIDVKCLDTLVNTAFSLKGFGAISPKFHYYHTTNLIEYAGCPPINILTARTNIIGSRKIDDGGYKGLIETSYAHGGGMLIPRFVIDSVGKMRDDYFLYYEELDWCERMKQAGLKIYCQRDAIIYHKESASVGRLSPLKTYYMNRSRLYFMRKNFRGSQLILFFIFYLAVSFPKNVLKFTFLNKRGHLRAYVRSLLWQVNSKYNFE
jgi:GT2 family glycosyltransferase